MCDVSYLLVAGHYIQELHFCQAIFRGSHVASQAAKENPPKLSLHVKEKFLSYI